MKKESIRIQKDGKAALITRHNTRIMLRITKDNIVRIDSKIYHNIKDSTPTCVHEYERGIHHTAIRFRIDTLDMIVATLKELKKILKEQENGKTN